MVVESVVLDSGPLPTERAAFDTYWIEGGHRIREQVADDRLLTLFLRSVLPPYSGAPITLFRGENRDRLSAGSIGLCWTPDSKVAQMFASGLNATGSGGALLKATFSASAIISGPNAHSVYLGEQQFTVDPFAIGDLRTVAVFPPIYSAIR